MDRYRVAPARPVCLYSAGPGGHHLRPGAPCGGSGRRSGGAEIGIFTAERYFSAADVVVRLHDGAVPLRPAPHPDHHHEPPPSVAASSDVASQSGRTAASSEASWNSRSRLLMPGAHSAAASRMTKEGSGGAVSASGHRRYGGGSNKKSSSSQRWTLFGRDCPCAGRKAVTVDDVASEPRSPATAASFDARFRAQSAVEECLESSAIFKAKTPSPLRPPTSEKPAKMKVTVTSGSRAFPLAANDDVLAVAAAPDRTGAAAPSEVFAAAIIGRRAGGFITFPDAAPRFTSSILDDEPPRASLEVFRPIDEDAVMLADPRQPVKPRASSSRGRGDLVVLRAAPPAVSAVQVDEEETMSDTSSDLFDLESFAALSSSYPTSTYHRGRGSRRNSSDDDDLIPPYAAALAEAPALRECSMSYAPSEASVVWSVTTAEGGAFDAASTANFSSAASACGGVDEFRFVVPAEPPAEFTAAMSRSAAAGRMMKSGGGGGFLNSCRCEKAVSVGPTPVRMMVKPPAYPAAAKKGSTGSAARCHPAGRVHVPVRT